MQQIEQQKQLATLSTSLLLATFLSWLSFLCTSQRARHPFTSTTHILPHHHTQTHTNIQTQILAVSCCNYLFLWHVRIIVSATAWKMQFQFCLNCFASPCAAPHRCGSQPAALSASQLLSQPQPYLAFVYYYLLVFTFRLFKLMQQHICHSAVWPFGHYCCNRLTVSLQNV